ncbi:helix-turn-helix domain-containing protein [Bifidobacterium porcinum]|uniref:helix-turn-helix domain-containing protein n=1 Tax=Bifidobacterium porcinum TaxID=212365 RepID=UPI0039910D50
MAIMNEGRLLTTKETAGKLGISIRRVQALVASGDLHSVRVGRTILIRAQSLNRYRRIQGHPGRPFSPKVAMGALFLISDEPAEWLTPQQRYRLKRYILGADAQSLVSRVRDRARTLDLFAAPPALDAMRENIHISGACEQHAEQFMLIPQKILEGYTSETTFRQLLRHHPLMEDHSTTTLRLHLTDCLPQRPEPMPIGVCAADLAVSADPRESQAGLHMIDKLLAIYRKEHGHEQ